MKLLKWIKSRKNYLAETMAMEDSKAYYEGEVKKVEEFYDEMSRFDINDADGFVERVEKGLEQSTMFAGPRTVRKYPELGRMLLAVIGSAEESNEIRKVNEEVLRKNEDLILVLKTLFSDKPNDPKLGDLLGEYEK